MERKNDFERIKRLMVKILILRGMVDGDEEKVKIVEEAGDIAVAMFNEALGEGKEGKK